MVMVFANEDDARKVLEVLPKRFGKYGLTLHPEKTRLVPFKQPPPRGGGKASGAGTFDFLGFCHHWGKSRKGNWVVKRKTSDDRFRRAVRSVTEWCRRNRHEPVRDQRQTLCLKLRGHYGYYGITGNFAALSRFQRCVQDAWFKWLNRRDQGRHITWQKFVDVLVPSLPRPRVVHSVYAARP
jgi:RNA-directed DNA polymerase